MIVRIALAPWLSVVVTALAALPTAAAAADAEPPSIAPEAIAYRVWTSAGCSRTLREKGAFADLDAACDLAKELRDTFEVVFVVHGPDEIGLALDAYVHLRQRKSVEAEFLPAEPEGLRATVARQTGRCGSWQEQAPTAEGATEGVPVFRPVAK